MPIEFTNNKTRSPLSILNDTSILHKIRQCSMKLSDINDI